MDANAKCGVMVVAWVWRQRVPGVPMYPLIVSSEIHAQSVLLIPGFLEFVYGCVPLFLIIFYLLSFRGLLRRLLLVSPLSRVPIAEK